MSTVPVKTYLPTQNLIADTLRALAPISSGVEVLHPDFSIDPVKYYEDLTSASNWNYAIYIINIVAFCVIGVGILAVASVLAPFSIPFIILGLGATFTTFHEYLCAPFLKRSVDLKSEIGLQELVVQYFTNLKSLSIEDIEKNYNFKLSEDDKKNKLPVLAAYLACINGFEQHSQTIENKGKALQIDIQSKTEDMHKNLAAYHEINNMHTVYQGNAYRLEEDLTLVLKVKAAWFLHLLTDPHFDKSFAETVTITPLHQLVRLRNENSSMLPPDLQNPYLFFPSEETFISKKAVKTLSVEDLSLMFSRGGAATAEAWKQFELSQIASPDDDDLV